jgi:hypothetical protein
MLVEETEQFFSSVAETLTVVVTVAERAAPAVMSSAAALRAAIRLRMETSEHVVWKKRNHCAHLSS